MTESAASCTLGLGDGISELTLGERVRNFSAKITGTNSLVVNYSRVKIYWLLQYHVLTCKKEERMLLH
jgi:hypothetical protein